MRCVCHLKFTNQLYFTTCLFSAAGHTRNAGILWRPQAFFTLRVVCQISEARARRLRWGGRWLDPNLGHYILSCAPCAHPPECARGLYTRTHRANTSWIFCKSVCRARDNPRTPYEKPQIVARNNVLLWYSIYTRRINIQFACTYRSIARVLYYKSSTDLIVGKYYFWRAYLFHIEYL